MNRISQVTTKDLNTRLELLPDKPGVYLFKDAAGEVIYVGKAVSLRNRVRSYFRAPRNITTKVLNMVKQVADLEYILTDSEVEALVLECNLIKEHRPRFNVRLRDDKNYPYLRVSVAEQWPRVMVARGFKNDGGRYFGPFAQLGSIQEIIRTLRQIFPFRTCSDARFRQHRNRPCLHYFIKRCPGPCAGLITPEAYRDVVDQLVMFLEGRGGQVLEQIRREMKEAAGRLEFERAAALRDRLRMLEAVIERQKVVLTRLGDEDFIALARSPRLDACCPDEAGLVEEACAHVFFVRGGKLVGREAFLLSQAGGSSDKEVLSAFLKQFYGLARDMPPVVNIPFEVDDQEVIASWLSALRGEQVSIRVPRRGDRRKLLDLARRNAESFLAAESSRRVQAAETEFAVLSELQRVLSLARLPIRIECYDISNIQGRFPIGSMVVFENGRPAKDEYRLFRIKGVTGPDDFAMMKEVFNRRFRRYLSESARSSSLLSEAEDGSMGNAAAGAFGRLPDLVIIDGGRGQLGAAASVMDSLGLGGVVPLFALAKENEWLFRRDQAEPVVLPRDSKALKLLQHIRDEAHRFAISHHRRTRSRSMLRSILDDIPGVGPKRRKTLLEHFPSLDALRGASIDEVAALPGMNRTVAEEILHTLAQKGF